MRPSLVHLEYIENINELICDGQIKKPKLAQEDAEIILSAVKTEKMEVSYQSENISVDFINLKQEEEKDVDPLLGYGHDEDLLSENSTSQDPLSETQLEMSEECGEAVPFFRRPMRNYLKKTPPRSSCKSLTPILPKLPELPQGCYFYHAETMQQGQPLSGVLPNDHSNLISTTPTPIVIVTRDFPSHISTQKQANWPTSTLPHGPTDDRFDASAQSASTLSQFLNPSPSIDKEMEYWDLESLETDPLEVLEMDVLNFASASESEQGAPMTLIVNDFSSTLQKNPKFISSKDMPSLGPRVNDRQKAKGKAKAQSILTFKASKATIEMIEMTYQPIDHEPKKIADLRNKLRNCLYGDSTLKSSLNWRDWISKDLKSCKLCLSVFKIKDTTALAHLAVVHKLSVCDQCDVVFKSAVRLFEHKQDVHNIHKYAMTNCVFCKLTFLDVTERNLHVKKCHIREQHKFRIAALSPNLNKAGLQVKPKSVPSILRRKRQ